MIEFSWDESYELEDEVIKQELLEDAYNHALDIDPMNGINNIPKIDNYLGGCNDSMIKQERE